MRAGFAVLWEAMIAELRARRLDLHAQATFTKEGDEVRDIRTLVADSLPRQVSEQELEVRTVSSASKLSRAFTEGFVEVG